MKKIKTCSTIIEALDFIDSLAKRKPKVTGLLSNRLRKGTYDRKGVLQSGEYEWAVRYNTKG